MKKFICALLSLALLASFAGCQSQNDTEANSTETSAATFENQTEDITAASSDSSLSQADPIASSVEESNSNTLANGETAAAADPAGKYAFIKDKKGQILKAESQSKIWAGVIGDAYILLRNISDANEWGEKGRVYELHCAQFAGKYSMWSDGYWEISDDGTELTLTPKNQSENGNIGVSAGKSKIFKGQNGVFSVPITFEQGGKTTITIDLNKVSK